MSTEVLRYIPFWIRGPADFHSFTTAERSTYPVYYLPKLVSGWRNHVERILDGCVTREDYEQDDGIFRPHKGSAK